MTWLVRNITGSLLSPTAPMVNQDSRCRGNSVHGLTWHSDAEAMYSLLTNKETK